jgi:hypothetical protein
MLNVIPKGNVIKVYALAWIAGYLILYFFLRDYLPEKYLRDFLTIQKLTDDAQAADWGGAYNIAAMVAGALPSWAIDILVTAIGSYTIWIIVTSLRSLKGMLLIIPVLAPMIVLDMVQFGKEIFVIPLTLIILRIAEKTPSMLKAFLAICVIYLLYGIFFRQYYLLILGSFMLIMLTLRSSPPFRLFYLLLLLVFMIAVPSRAFMELQGDRDAINQWSNLVTNTVRTAIYNPFVPDNGFHFALNYLYVFLKLNLPILFDQTLNEIILFVNILIYGRLIYAGIRQRPMTAVTLLPWLFLAHISVLTIFEPDSGSYFRHFSSVLLYLIPALRRLEQEYAQRVLSEKNA